MSSTDRNLLLHLFAESKNADYASASDSDFFELFVPFHFLKHYDLDYNDIEDGVVDGASDGGIDSIFCLCDGRLLSETDMAAVRKNAKIDLFVFTNKFQNSFPTGVINDLRVTLSDILELDDDLFNKAADNYNDDLIDIVLEFRSFYVSIASKFPKLHISVVYATASAEGAKSDVTSRLEQIKSDLEERFSDCVADVIAADARALLAIVRENPEEVRSLQLSGSSINLSKGPSYISLAKLTDYYNFILRDDGNVDQRLFDDNVRDFEGDVQVNREINASLSEDTGLDFWWLNNGVSIICDAATLSGNQLQVKSPKIVNGLQTSRCLFRHFANEKSNKSDDRLILVRVITAKDEDVRAEIIRATNRQTPIAPAQLIATSKIHRDIELFLKSKGIFYERRKNHWKNQGKSRGEIVTITDLAQAMITVVAGKPNTARARPGSLLKESNNVVFDVSYDMKIYEKAVNLIRATDALIQEELPECGRRDRNNIKYQVAAKIVYESCGKSFSPQRFLNNDFVQPAVRKKIIQKTYKLYTDGGATDRVAKSDEFWAEVRGSQV